jgi:NRAMP (natural resistance-associated macrophage protein)-like metal ion transporter
MPYSQIEKTSSAKNRRKKSLLGLLGPGVITGASDDDPSGIATYSQAGAQFGFGMLGLALFLFPLMNIVQEMCARLGLVTGKGLAAIIQNKYSKKVALPIAGLLIIANAINIGADIRKMVLQPIYQHIYLLPVNSLGRKFL